MAYREKRYRSFEEFERQELDACLTIEDMNDNVFDFVEDMDCRDEDGEAQELPF